MAKSLFAQSPCQRPEKAIISDEFVRESSNKPSEKAKSQASFDELQKIFVASHQGHSLSIGLSVVSKDACRTHNILWCDT